MKRTARLRFALVALSCAAPGCRTGTEPPPSTALEVTARATPSRLGAGERAWVDVAIRNRSSRAYAIPGGRFLHYQGTVEVHDDGAGSRLTWTIDLLPDEYADGVRAMMKQGADVMRTTLQREPRGNA